MKKLKYLLALILCMFIVSPVLAEENANSKSEMYISAEDNVYVDENILGSSFLAGNNIETKGKVAGIGFLAGNNIKINNNVDYLVTAGNNIDVNSNVVKDMFVAGNIITISKDAVIGRDAMIAASEVNIYGNIERNVKIYATTVDLKGATITGSIEVYADNINIDKSTKIIGELKYNENAKTSIQATSIGNTKTYKVEEYKVTFMDTILSNAISNASLLLVFLVIALLFPKVFEKINNKMDKMNLNTPFELFVKGFVALVVIPFIAILLFTSVIGVSLGLILLVTYIVAIYLSKLFVGYILGKLILTKAMKKEDNTLLNGFIGIIGLFILSLIPYINSVTSFITLLIGLGLAYLIVKPEKNKK